MNVLTEMNSSQRPLFRTAKQVKLLQGGAPVRRNVAATLSDMRFAQPASASCAWPICKPSLWHSHRAVMGWLCSSSSVSTCFPTSAMLRVQRAPQQRQRNHFSA
jgi:hypothetical protein